MKKILLSVISILAIQSAIFGAADTVVKQVKKAPIPVTIDGDIDDVWVTADGGNIDNLVIHFEAAYDTNDITGSFKLLYDDTYLYILLDVTDDTLVRDGKYAGDQTFISEHDDGFDITFDLLNEKIDEQLTYIYSNKEHYQMLWGCYNPSGTIDFSDEAKVTFTIFNINGVVGKVKNTQTGYIMEMAVPLVNMWSYPVSVGQKFGLGIRINDDDGKETPGQRESVVGWDQDATANTNWNTPSTWGTAVFSAEYAKEPHELDSIDYKFNEVIDVIRSTDSISVKYAISNLGSDIGLDYTKALIVISADSIMDEHDYVIANQLLTVLESNEVDTLIFKDTISTNINGNYVLISINNSGSMPELTDTNNMGISLINYIKPDLSANITHAIRIADSIWANCTIENMGSDGVYSNVIAQIILSEDESIDHDDYIVAQHSISLIDKGQVLNLLVEDTISFDVNGSYILVNVIYDMPELKLDNNFTSSPINFYKTDYVLSNTSIALRHTDSVWVDVVIANKQQDSALSNTSVKLYLSEDGTIDGDDYQFDEFQIGKINGNDSLTTVYKGLIPVDSTGKFILVEIDSDNKVYEMSEVNNNGAIDLKGLSIDLRITMEASVFETFVDSSFVVHPQIANIGTFSAQSPSLVYYLSDDDDLSADDKKLFIGSIEILHPDSIVTRNDNITMPSDIEPGIYALLLSVNGNKTLPESSMDNNEFIAYLNISKVSNIHNQELKNISVYPNPAHNMFSIESELNSGSWTIRNTSGATLKSGTITQTNQQISVEELQPGLYILVVQSQNRSKVVKLSIY